MKATDIMMDISYSWRDFILLLFCLCIVYIALLSIKTSLKDRIKKVFDVTLNVYETVSILLILVVFFLIKPALHGLILIAVLGMGFQHLRNYVHSRLFHIMGHVKKGLHIKVDDQKGIITHMGRLGIEMKSDVGLHQIPYDTLVKKGYILSSGERIGGYYRLQVNAKEGTLDRQRIQELIHVLYSSPYVDSSYRPEIVRSLSDHDMIDVKLLVKEEHHIRDLIEVLEEQGYLSVIIKSQ